MKDTNDNVLVLLATYNGSLFISEQIKSIINQSNKNVRILLSDDSSEDSTIEKVKSFSSNTLSICEDSYSECRIKGHVANFNFLSKRAVDSEERYFCFSDQDDVWRENKLELMLRRMKKLESIHGDNTPILIHSDLRVVDEQLNEIAPSFVKFQGLPDPLQHDFPKFFYQNVVTGCATFFNRALLEIAIPIPENALVHDWWFAQCAKLFGVVDYIDKPLIDYRQHGKNSIGAKNYEEQRSYWNKYIYQALMRFPQQLSKSVEQAKSLNDIAQKNKKDVSLEKLAMLECFSNLKNLPAKIRIKWADIAIENHKSLLERCYFKFAFFIVKWID